MSVLLITLTSLPSISSGTFTVYYKHLLNKNINFCYSSLIIIGFQNDDADGFSVFPPSRKKCWLFGDEK